MSISQPNIQNQQLVALASRAGGEVTSAIKQASSHTGVDFAYLMQQAQAESAFQTDVKAKTSSATGLFQFIDRTWLDMVAMHGDKYGIDTSAPKSELLALRKDPEVSSFMAAELANENRTVMKARLGENADIGATDLYLAHFMGPGKAAGFIESMNKNPEKAAAYLFPTEAKANHGVFYNAKGQARSLSEVYSFFDKKFQIKDGSVPNDIEIAQKQPDVDEARLKEYVAGFMGLQKEEIAQNAQLDQQAAAIKALSVRHSTSDIFSAGKTYSTTSLPIMREENRYPSVAFGNFVQNPADILWLAQLNDDLSESNKL